jgi:hypothetical protein
MFTYSCLNSFLCHNRPSSPDLVQAAIAGITVMGGEVKDYGVVTTPMLHYFVASINTDGIYGEPTEDGYFKKMTTAFKELRGDVSYVNTFYCIYYQTPNRAYIVMKMHILAYVCYLIRKDWLTALLYLYVCSPVLNFMTDFHENCYEHLVTRFQTTVAHFNFL